MFEMTMGEDGSLRLKGRLDAAQVEKVSAKFEKISGPCVLDFAELDYISSAGLGLLFATHKRLADSGGGLSLVNLKPHIQELFRIAGFDRVFTLD